jgi:hypothetical protein
VCLALCAFTAQDGGEVDEDAFGASKDIVLGELEAAGVVEGSA